MDTLISAEVVNARRKRIVVFSLLGVVVLLAAIWLLRYSISNTIDAGEIATATVEIGDIENTLTASGEVLPEFEEVITSPIAASVRQVLLDAGTQVKTGDAILSLDKQAALNEYEKLEFQLESKRNSIKKMKLELNKSFFDISSNNDIKQLRISSLQSAVEDAKRLYKAGGGTREQIEQAELNLKVALLEKKQLENEILSKQQTMKVDIRESEIAAAVQERDLIELGRKLKEADIKASRAGVITWVNKNIGSAIAPGESLVRIADLSSFKITGKISDSYLDQVKPGMAVIVKINDSTMRGTVSNINPSVQNASVQFDVALDEKHNAILRPNMKVDVYLVTTSKTNVMRVANGPAFKGAATQDIFIVREGKAVRKTVDIGLTNFDYVEVKGDVHAGDVIIISDMSRFSNAKEINIKNQKTDEKKNTARNTGAAGLLLAKLEPATW